MKNTQSRLFGYIFRNKKTSLLFRILTVILFIILAAAFAVSITYSMIMEENFYKRTGNGIRKEYSKNFLVVMYQTSDDFLQKFREGIYKKAEEKHIRIDFINVESINEAINIINTAVAAKVDGIIAQGIYDSDYIQVIKKAIENGITVEFVFTDAWGIDRAYFVGYNAYDYGKMASRSAIEQLHETKGDIALMVQSVTYNEKDVTGGLFIEGFKSIASLRLP